MPLLKGNLHTHTTFSDGRLPAEDVVARYRDLGYDFLAITDHEDRIDDDYWFRLPPGDDRMLVLAGVEGMKTIAYELAEQLGQRLPQPATPWRAPDWYIQSVSGGLGPVGVIKGFRELKTMGLIDRLPRLACIQAEGCAPMVSAFRRRADTADPVSKPATRIATLATGNPGRAYTILKAYIDQNGGMMESVSDDEAYRALHVLAKMEGISMEPAAAVASAGPTDAAPSTSETRPPPTAGIDQRCVS